MTGTLEDPTADPARPTGRRRSLTLGGAAVTLALVVFVGFWTWALFFASKEAVNKIDDRAWAERAESICADAERARDDLADYRRIDPDDAELLRERADLIDRSTDIVEEMLDDVTAVEPTDPKGRDIVPQWESDYRSYIDSRRDYAEVTRTGRDEPFRQEAIGSIPISERIERFAVDNEMPSCAPPRDL
ncbi:MAG: hypothetical protein WD225_03065 [Ilumatobacteraceae bacterium]